MYANNPENSNYADTKLLKKINRNFDFEIHSGILEFSNSEYLSDYYSYQEPDLSFRKRFFN